MQDRFRDMRKATVGRWKAQKPTRKILLGMFGAALVVTLSITIYMTTRVEWMVLVNGLDASEIGQIQNELKEQNIDSKFVGHATGISVPKKLKNEALIVLANSSAVSSMDFTFQDAIGASGMGSTESVKRASFKRLFESDLNRKLASLEWVESANSTIFLPDIDKDLDQVIRRPTAGIVLQVTSQPDDVQTANVAEMVARSVRGLSLDDIEIVDQYANTIYSGLLNSLVTPTPLYVE